MPPRTFSRAPRPASIGASGSALFGVELDDQLEDQLQRLGDETLPFVLMAASEFLSGRVLATPRLFERDVAADKLRELKMHVDSAYLGRQAFDLAETLDELNDLKAFLDFNTSDNVIA